MRTFKILFFFLLTAFNSCFLAQLNQQDSKGRKQGAWQKTYPKSDILQYKGQFRDDKPVGTFTYYYPAGQLKAIIEHHPDGMHSRAYFYFENKMLMTEGFYFNQKKDSTWVNYNAEGLVLGLESFKNDKLNGKKVIYYLEGQIETEKLNPLSFATYENDTLNGEYKEFFSTGKLKLMGKYKSGKRIGEWKEYYPNGSLYKVFRYKNDLIHGWSTTYNKDGEENGKFLYQYGEKLSSKDLEAFLKLCDKKGLDPNQ
jgi:antitoxin component YwqK of YwqJK toxin-antitoxin module